MATEYGSRLKKARNHAGLTQVELSKKTGIPQSTISTAERIGNGSGETPVYAQACGVDALWLATGNGEMLPPPAQLPVPTQNKATSTTSVEDGAINSGAKLAESLNVLAQVLCAVPESERDAVSRKLASLAMAPDSAQLLQSLQTALQQAKQAATDHTKPPNNTVRGIAGQVLAQKLTTESTDFQSGRTKV